MTFDTNKFSHPNLFSKFLRMGLSVIVIQLTTIGLSPVIARLFDATAFGYFSAFNSVQSILITVMSAKYDSAVVAAKSDCHSINLLVLSLLLGGGVAALLTICLVGVVFYGNLDPLFGGVEVLILLPASAFVNIFHTALNEFHLRNSEIRNVVLVRFTSATATSMATILFGLLSMSNGLVYGYCIGMFLSIVCGCCNIATKNQNSLKLVSRSRIFEVAKSYKRFPKYLLPAQLINNLATGLPIMYMSQIIGFKEAGILALVDRVLYGPISLIGTAARDVLKNQARLSYEKTGQCKELFKTTTKWMLGASVVFFSVTFFLAEEIFVMVFGEGWKEAGQYARIMAFSYAVTLIATPTSCFISLSDRQDLEIVWQIGFLVLSLIPILVGVLNKNTYLCLILISGSRSLAFLFLFFINYHVAIKRLRQV